MFRGVRKHRDPRRDRLRLAGARTHWDPRPGRRCLAGVRTHWDPRPGRWCLAGARTHWDPRPGRWCLARVRTHWDWKRGGRHQLGAADRKSASMVPARAAALPQNRSVERPVPTTAPRDMDRHNPSSRHGRRRSR